MTKPKNLGDRLNRFLTDNDITHAEAAAKINRTTRTVSRIIAGHAVSARTWVRVEKMMRGEL